MKSAPFLAVIFLSAVYVALLPPSASLKAAERFLRGDVDESTFLHITDAIRILESLFLGHAQRGCLDAADVNDDGQLNVTDPIMILRHLFQGAPPPPPPYPFCGPDPTEDSLGCEEFDICPEGLTFFGLSIDADGIFFVIDRSTSMQNTGELPLVRRETARAMLAFQPEVQFGIAFFDTRLLKFPTSDQPASAGDAAAINSARVFVVASPSGGPGTCGQDALLAAVQYAKSSTARKKAIFYVSDGAGTCSGADEATYLRQTLEAVTAENAGLAAIHTIGLLSPQSIRERFLKDLAGRNGGTYTQR